MDVNSIMKEVDVRDNLSGCIGIENKGDKVERLKKALLTAKL